MLSPGDHELQQSWGATGLAGCWMLPPGEVLSLRPHRAAVLRIRYGRAWATLGERPRGHGALAGDHFLLAGEQLSVRRGRHLVLQSIDGGALGFEWRHAAGAQERWRQPLDDLAQAVRLVGRAAWGLLRGLAWTALALRPGRRGS